MKAWQLSANFLGGTAETVILNIDMSVTAWHVYL